MLVKEIATFTDASLAAEHITELNGACNCRQRQPLCVGIARPSGQGLRAVDVYDDELNMSAELRALSQLRVPSCIRHRPQNDCTLVACITDDYLAHRQLFTTFLVSIPPAVHLHIS